ncbi:MAG: glycosyltransferase family 2 protein, partial [Ignavibacteriaceae bacterium]
MKDAINKNFSFSIIIPTYNEQDYIANCINSILNQNYSKELLEIIIVDGNSQDNTLSIIRDYQQYHPCIKIKENPGRKTSQSLNIGIKASIGEIVVILGAHTTLDRDFISYNNKYLNEKNVKVTGGTQINIGSNYVQKAIAMAMENPFGMGSAPYRWSKKEQFLDTVVYAAYRRELFDEIGYFEENFSMGDDAELNWRIRKAGYKILFNPNIKSYYHPRKTIPKFIQQMFRYGILRVNMFKRHTSAATLTHLIPPLFILTLLTLLIFALSSIVAWTLPISLFLLYLLVNLFSVVLKTSKKDLRFIPLVTFLIFILHFSWGLGFI